MVRVQSAHNVDPAVRLRQLQALPPLSPVAQRLLGLLERDDLTLGQLSSVIEMDPALTARLLGLANAAFFANAQAVCSISDAVGRVLGLDLVKHLALGLVLSGAFDARRCAGFRAEQFWFLSMGSATLAMPIASLLDGHEATNPDCLYLGGLLHELGLLALCSVCPEEMSRALNHEVDPESARPESHSVRVRALLGISPMEAGAVLARRWRLPEPIAVIMAHYGDHHYRGPYWQGNAIVGLAATLALGLYHGHHDPDRRTPWMSMLGLSEDDVTSLIERHETRVESLRSLSRHLTSI